MNTYLIQVTTAEGQHEHRSFAMVKAKSFGLAHAVASDLCQKYDNGRKSATRVTSIDQITTGEASSLRKLGLAKFTQPQNN